MLIELENDLNNFKLSIDQTDKKKKKLAKKEYQKVTHENKQLKQQILGLRKAYHNKEQIKRKYVIEQPEVESSSEESGEEQEQEQEQYPKIVQKKNKTKIKKEPIKAAKKNKTNKNCLNI